MCKLILFLCRIYYKKYNKAIFYIKGTGKDMGRYLLYTENPNTAERMDRF